MENKHLSMTRFGPRGLNLVNYSISEELKQCVSENNLLKALRLGVDVGVNEFRALRHGFHIGNTTKKLLTYTG